MPYIVPDRSAKDPASQTARCALIVTSRNRLLDMELGDLPAENPKIYRITVITIIRVYRLGANGAVSEVWWSD